MDVLTLDLRRSPILSIWRSPGYHKGGHPHSLHPKDASFLRIKTASCCHPERWTCLLCCYYHDEGVGDLRTTEVLL